MDAAAPGNKLGPVLVGPTGVAVALNDVVGPTGMAVALPELVTMTVTLPVEVGTVGAVPLDIGAVPLELGGGRVG